MNFETLHILAARVKDRLDIINASDRCNVSVAIATHAVEGVVGAMDLISEIDGGAVNQALLEAWEAKVAHARQVIARWCRDFQAVDEVCDPLALSDQDPLLL